MDLWDFEKGDEEKNPKPNNGMVPFHRGKKSKNTEKREKKSTHTRYFVSVSDFFFFFDHFPIQGELQQIQRIIVSCKDPSTYQLTFELSFPATIKKSYIENIKKYNVEMEPNIRQMTIHRVNGDSGYPQDGVLADNRFLMIEFTDKMDVSSLLSHFLME